MLFIGSIYPNNILEDIIKEKTHADFAANTFQSGIIEGLQKCYKEVRIITSPVTSTYPKSQTLIYHKQKYSDAILINGRLIKPDKITDTGLFENSILHSCL